MPGTAAGLMVMLSVEALLISSKPDQEALSSSFFALPSSSRRVS
jgi:hypothetical protein